MRDRGATRALVLGLLSLAFGVLGPFAVWSGASSLARIRGSGGTLRGTGSAAAGLIAGSIGLATLVAGIGYWWIASS